MDYHNLPVESLYSNELSGWCCNSNVSSGEYASYYVAFKKDGSVSCDCAIIDAYGNLID